MLNNINKHKSVTATAMTGIDNSRCRSCFNCSFSSSSVRVEKDNCKIKQQKGKENRPCLEWHNKNPSAQWGNFMVQRF